MRKTATLGLLSLSLSCCGLARQSEKEPAIARCHEQYPTLERSTAIERVKCENAAYDIMRPSLGHDDLFNLHHTSALLIAERFQNGQLTAAEAEQQLALMRSQIVSEAEHRDAGNRASRAAASAALTNAGAAMMATPRASSTNCTRYGPNLNCTTY